MSSARGTVVLLHGLGRTRLSMAYAAFNLSRRGFRVLNVGYPSRRLDLDSLAEHVGKRIDRKLGGDRPPLSFLTHSMGGIVLRTAVARETVATPNRVVMLSPPNQGSRMATTLQPYAVFRTILGPSAQQLRRGAGDGPTTLGPAAFTLGVITGDGGFNPVLSSLTDEAHDGLVSVDEAQLEGMADFLVVPYGHTFIMNRRVVLEQVAWFFEHGRFRGAVGMAGRNKRTEGEESSQLNLGQASASTHDPEHSHLPAVPAVPTVPAESHHYTNTWFSTFLDTIDESQTAREVAFLERHVPLSTHPTVVDLCCGSGRHARQLAARGYRIIGIDNNRGALDRAREIGDDNVQYHELDMRALKSLALEADALLLLWQSFGQFDDATNENILMQIHQSLRPGGRFVLDIYNRHFFENRCGTRQSGRGGATVTETKEMLGNRLVVRLDYAGSNEDDCFDWRVYATDELLAIASTAGFRPVVSCANWVESISPSAEIPRTQFVFERG